MNRGLWQDPAQQQRALDRMMHRLQEAIGRPDDSARRIGRRLEEFLQQGRDVLCAESVQAAYAMVAKVPPGSSKPTAWHRRKIVVVG